MTKITFVTTLLLTLMYSVSFSQSVSKSFELRYFSDSTIADGTIGFNGDSTFFSPEERLNYLTEYADYAKFFFQDKDLDKKPIESKGVEKALSNIKLAPTPKNRQRLMLNDWKWKTYRTGQSLIEEKRLATWTNTADAIVDGGILKAVNDFSYAKKFDQVQDWRFVFQWETKIPKTEERSAFLLLDEKGDPVVLMGVTAEGGCFYKSRIGLPIGVAEFDSDTLINFKLLVDVQAGRFSLFINDELKADFVRTLSENPVSRFFMKLPVNATIDNIYGLSYDRPEIQAAKGQFPVPSGRVFMDERFEISEEIGDLALASFRDAEWGTLKLPVQSGDRFRDSDLILRKPLLIGSFERAILHLEHISPETEIWLNNRIVYVHREGQQLDLDISRDLFPNQPNRLMFRMRGGDGWQLEKVWLDITGNIYVEDAFAYTENLTDTAFLRIQAKLHANQLAGSVNGRWQGRMNVKITPWHPKGTSKPVVNTTFPLTLRAYKTEDFSELIPIRRPQIWSPDAPNLYKIELSLLNSKGQFVDEYVFTTGVRKLDQTNGTFHLNGNPMPLFGVNLSDYLPFEVEAYSEPTVAMDEWLVQAVASIKAMNANVVRVTNLKNIDTESLLSICDQMGLMVIQEVDRPENGEPWKVDFDALKVQIEALRGHPSLVIWQAPDGLRFNNYLQDATKWMERFFQTVRFHDTDALISLTGIDTEFGETAIPNDNGTRLYESSLRRYRLLSNPSVWTDAKVVRGNADRALSFGQDWDDLRTFPIDYITDTLRQNYLNSQEHIYINFDSESLPGQENPATVRGIPYRYSETYQSPYTSLTLGTELVFEDWEKSQALQGFANYEALRKKRWLGYDGIISASLWNGGDPTTLLDAKGFSKLAYYTSRMAFQTALAGSKTTDLAYNLGEKIPIFLNYTGKAARFQVTLKVKNKDGRVLETQTFPMISFPSGSSTAEVGAWVNSLTKVGWFLVEYDVVKR